MIRKVVHIKTENIILIGIIIICSIFIIVNLIKRNPKLIINAGLRTVVGALGIYFIDSILRSQGYQIQVGINEATLLTNGILGLPGFIMLYGLAYFYSVR